MKWFRFFKSTTYLCFSSNIMKCQHLWRYMHKTIPSHRGILCHVGTTCVCSILVEGVRYELCVYAPEQFGVGVLHYNDIIMGAIKSQITSLTIVYCTVSSGADHRKHHSSASLTFVWGIHRWLVNSPSKWPVTRKMCPFDDVSMSHLCCYPCHFVTYSTHRPSDAYTC